MYVSFAVGVSAIILNGHKILLMKRSLAKDHAPGEWEPVSGRVEEDESAIEALYREVSEETQLVVECIAPIDTWRISRGQTKQTLIGITFLCRYVEGDLALSDEHDEAVWVPLEEVSGRVGNRTLKTALERCLPLIRTLADYRS